VLLRRAIVQSRAQSGGPHDAQSERDTPADLDTPAERDALAELKERLTVSAQRGERTHLREETWLALEFPDAGAGTPRAALALARDNFNAQRETEDVRLFARAVIAARDPEALASLKTWLQHSHYQDVVVDQLLRSVDQQPQSVDQPLRSGQSS
jgi:hypothetical protein